MAHRPASFTVTFCDHEDDSPFASLFNCEFLYSCTAPEYSH